jgi:hypothetical protein
MSFRAYVRRAEAEARRLGVRLSMAKLRDAIARSIYIEAIPRQLQPRTLASLHPWFFRRHSWIRYVSNTGSITSRCSVRASLPEKGKTERISGIRDEANVTRRRDSLLPIRRRQGVPVTARLFLHARMKRLTSA